MSEFEEHEEPTKVEKTMTRRTFIQRSAAGLSAFLLPMKENKDSARNQSPIVNDAHAEHQIPKPVHTEKSAFLTNLERISSSQKEADSWNRLDRELERDVIQNNVNITNIETSNVQTYEQTPQITRHRALTLAAMSGSDNEIFKQSSYLINEVPKDLLSINPDEATILLNYIGDANQPLSSDGIHNAIDLAGYGGYLNALYEFEKSLPEELSKENKAQAMIRYANSDGRIPLANAFFATRVEAYLTEERLLRNMNIEKPLIPPPGTDEYRAAGGDTNSPEWLETVSNLAGLTHAL